MGFRGFLEGGVPLKKFAGQKKVYTEITVCSVAQLHEPVCDLISANFWKHAILIRIHFFRVI